MSNKNRNYKSQKERMLTLSHMRYNMCGIGTRRVKLLLNRLSVNSPIASALRLILEIEDFNIRAKFCPDKTYLVYYSKKHKLIRNLVSLCQDNNFVFGIQTSDVNSTSHIVYFDIPGVRQISFHTSFSEEDLSEIPHYPYDWDGEDNSILIKAEEAISNLFSEELSKLKKRTVSLKPITITPVYINAIRTTPHTKIREFFKFNRENSSDIIRAALPSVCSELNKPENYFKYIRIDFSDNGVFCSKSYKDKRFNFILQDNNSVEIFSDHKFVNGYCLRKDFIKISKIRYADNPEQKVNTTDIVSYQQDKAEERKQRNILNTKMEHINIFKNYALNWDSISDTITSNPDHYIEVRLARKGIFYFLNKRCNPIIDLDFKPVLHSQEENKKYDLTDMVVPVSKLHLHKSRIDHILERFKENKEQNEK